jgi:hypothetical protein
LTFTGKTGPPGWVHTERSVTHPIAEPSATVPQFIWLILTKMIKMIAMVMDPGMFKHSKPEIKTRPRTTILAV